MTITDIFGIFSGVLSCIASIITIWKNRSYIGKFFKTVGLRDVLDRLIMGMLMGIVGGIPTGAMVALLSSLGDEQRIVSGGLGVAAWVGIPLLVFGFLTDDDPAETNGSGNKDVFFALGLGFFGWLLGFAFGELGLVLDAWFKFFGAILAATILLFGVMNVIDPEV